MKQKRVVFPPLKIFRPVDDPLEGLEDTGSVQENAKQELTAIQTSFKDSVANEKKNITHRFDTEYWFAVVFEDRAQKTAFLTALGLLAEGDKYVNGYLLAHRLNIELPMSPMRYDWNDKMNKTERF